MDQNTEFLAIIESLRKRLQKREPFDLNDLKKLLVKHKICEEKSIYPLLDQEIDDFAKSVIIDRIKRLDYKKMNISNEDYEKDPMLSTVSSFLLC